MADKQGIEGGDAEERKDGEASRSVSGHGGQVEAAKLALLVHGLC